MGSKTRAEVSPAHESYKNAVILVFGFQFHERPPTEYIEFRREICSSRRRKKENLCESPPRKSAPKSVVKKTKQSDFKSQVHWTPEPIERQSETTSHNARKKRERKTHTHITNTIHIPLIGTAVRKNSNETPHSTDMDVWGFCVSDTTMAYGGSMRSGYYRDYEEFPYGTLESTTSSHAVKDCYSRVQGNFWRKNR